MIRNYIVAYPVYYDSSAVGTLHLLEEKLHA